MHWPHFRAKLPQGAESNILPHLPWWQLFSHRWLKNTSTAYVLSLTNLENTIWNESHPSVTFRNEITYLANWVLKDGVCPSNSNLEAIAECTPHKHTQRCVLFSACWASTGGSSKGLCILHIPIVSILPGKVQQEVRVGVTVRRSHKGLWNIETGMYDGPHLGVYRLHQTVLVRDWHI